MSKTILVTGGTGLLGAHLLYHLCSQGHMVKATKRASSSLDLVQKIFAYYQSADQSFLKNIEWQEVELDDVLALSEALEDVNYLYHCAATVSFNPRKRKQLTQNVEITSCVVNAALAAKVDKLVHVSSVAALGRAKQGSLIDESSQWTSSTENSVYAESKYWAELEVWRGMEEGLNAVIVNPCIILGPGPWSSGSTAIFGKVAKGFKFYTHGENAYVDARDVSRAMHLLMESTISHNRFVLAAENWSYRKMFGRIAKAIGAKEPTVLAKPWMGKIVWRIEKWRSFLLGSDPMITKETAKTAHQVNRYNGSKICEAVNFRYRGLEETVEDIAGFYKEEHKLS